MSGAHSNEAIEARAADWLRAKGCRRMVGPFNFTINDESGLLVEGFDTPPAVFMTQSRPWMGPLLERAGMAKEMDLLAYRMTPRSVGDHVKKMARLVHNHGHIVLRAADMSQYKREVELLEPARLKAMAAGTEQCSPMA